MSNTGNREGGRYLILTARHKRVIDDYMKKAIEDNVFVSLKLLMPMFHSNVTHVNKQHVIDYIDAKFPKGYLMNEQDFDRLESLIKTAANEYLVNNDLATSTAISMAMRSRDCNFLECYDKHFKKTQRDN